jgi:hypothetical protein
MGIVGQVISGEFGKVLVRQKSDNDIELGELLVAESNDSKILFQVYDLMYGSQISQQNLELMSGLKLEEDNDLEVYDSNLRNYKLALMKNLITLKKNNSSVCKTLPCFFCNVREIDNNDVIFPSKPQNSITLGKLRSGSKVLDIDVNLPGDKVLAEHLLVAASTGKGKSNLVKSVLWNLVDKEYCGVLVLDPHDEYYGRNGIGLKDHSSNGKIVYYSSSAPVGCRSLKINFKSVKPEHLKGIVSLSDPQIQAMYAYYSKYGSEWIVAIAQNRSIEHVSFKEDTINVIRRIILGLFSISLAGIDVVCSGVFDNNSGSSTIKEIVNDLTDSKTVIIDTSSLPENVELLISSVLCSELLKAYQYFKKEGVLNNKPVISIVLEEAPRVLGKDVLETGPNIFSTIAREGRKFKIGLLAITQLPSLIPRQILANMNTKILLGIEMAPERNAIIESASQDLSDDSRTIASLDKGEAIVTSNFVSFATPVRIPLFDDIVKKTKESRQDFSKKDFSGVKL